MSSTRDFKSPGIFAEDATTVIPPTPIAGVAYRDAVSGTVDTPNGWRYGTRVDSQDWNQVMFMITSMLAMMDTKGVLGWSSSVDYTEAAIAFGSDGKLYSWVQASGPGTGAGVKDPVTNPLYWGAVPINALGTVAEMATGTSLEKAPSIAAVMSLFSKRAFTANDYIRIPDVPGGLIIQWGSFNTGTIGNGTGGAQTLPIAYTNAHLQTIVGSTGGVVSGNASDEGFSVSGLTLSNFSWVSSWNSHADDLGQIRYVSFGY